MDLCESEIRVRIDDQLGVTLIPSTVPLREDARLVRPRGGLLDLCAESDLYPRGMTALEIVLCHHDGARLTLVDP